MLRALLACLLLSVCSLSAAGPVYVVLWFDTEDYIQPAADDAALRIANDLTARRRPRDIQSRRREGARAGKARPPRRHRRAFAARDRLSLQLAQRPSRLPPSISSISDTSKAPTSSSAAKAPGVADVKRIFGSQPACYGQPGSSWGPQSNLALRRLGIPVYLDEGDQVGVDEQPFWYGGLLYVFHMGRNQFRAQLNVGAEDTAAYQRFDEAAARLASAGGGVISIYYHPTEFVTTEFWDAVNFAHGANPARGRVGRSRVSGRPMNRSGAMACSAASCST